MSTIVLLLLLLIGIAIYFVNPKSFFLYWLSIQPFILPVFYLLFVNDFTPVADKFLPLYFEFPQKLGFLMVFLLLLSFHRSDKGLKSLKVLFLPLFLLASFLLVQNILVGFDARALYTNAKSILWSVVPLALLVVDKRLRPTRKSFIRFIFVFVYVQSFFCILNWGGITIYGDVTGGFDEHLLCGTFTRYNHMANYLTVFFFILTYECFGSKRIKRKKYFGMAFLIGFLILISGSRMALMLYVFTCFYFFCVYYQNKKFVFITIVLSVLLLGFYLKGNKNFSGQGADEGTGYERNMIGVIDLANADDITEGNTLSMSAQVLFFYLNSPYMGNGQLYREGFFYGNPKDPRDTYNNADVFKTDARLAFMFVEYGIIGLCMFFYLFASMYKGCYLYSEEKNKALYWGAGLYFLLFSLTDNGFWDYIIFPSILIYVFSKRNFSEKATSRLLEKI